MQTTASTFQVAVRLPSIVATRPDELIMNIFGTGDPAFVVAFTNALKAERDGKRLISAIASAVGIRLVGDDWDISTISDTFKSTKGRLFTVRQFVDIVNSELEYRYVIGNLTPSVQQHLGVTTTDAPPPTPVATPDPTDIRPGPNSNQPFHRLFLRGDPALNNEFFNTMTTPVNGVYPLQAFLPAGKRATGAVAQQPDLVVKLVCMSNPAYIIALANKTPYLKDALTRLSLKAREQFGFIIAAPPGAPVPTHPLVIPTTVVEPPTVAVPPPQFK